MFNRIRRKQIKATTMFKQLILNVILPVVAALIILSSINYYTTKSILTNSNRVKNYIISDEIKHIMELQDLALNIVEDALDDRMENFSAVLVEDVFDNTDSIEDVDLEKIRIQIGMNPLFEDIYIIDPNGIVVNTTFKADLHRNFFDFGEDHKEHLLKVLKGNEFVNERFAIETSTKRLKKYTYQPTSNHKYIVELGSYSKKADEIIEFIQNSLRNISNKESDILSVDLFIGEVNPFCLNQDALQLPSHDTVLAQVFHQKDTSTIIEDNEEGTELNYEYIYMEREGTNLYKGSVIRIISDRSRDKKLLMRELLKALIIFSLTIIAVVLLIYSKTRVITRPIKKLVNNVNRIADGKLDDRATIEGNNEIAKLSEHFNAMLERIEGFYNELEQKVKERTAEIAQKKEEIEAQRDDLADKNAKLETAYHKIEEQNIHITDSIKYAKRIQTAIIPPASYVQGLLETAFVLYKPKDIVSGDFYWAREVNNKIAIVAADCTGHGVPGAFMSMLGMSFLNEIVKENYISNAGGILDELRIQIKTSLRQTGKKGEQKDGMDISLCIFDKDKKKVLFSGANNSMVLIRNNELTEVKADRMPIGIYDNEYPFTNHVVDLEKGDLIYIHTDGYPDQFGGPKNKKFMMKKFRQLLHEIHQEPIEDQREILDKHLFDWMGKNEQLDDILVIGVKV